jgi:hypothetical protein
MASERPESGEQEFREEEASLVRITFGPLIWVTHFLVSYAATAVFCAKLAGGAAGIGTLRWGIAVATALALSGIAWAGRRSWHQWRHSNEDSIIEDDADGSHEDRHQFLGHAALLLTVISFIGVIYTALPALLTASCR